MPKWTLLMTLVNISILGLVGAQGQRKEQSPVRSLDVECLSLRDSRGVLRAQLRAFGEGRSSLMFFDEGGGSRIEVGMVGGDAVLQMSDRAGRARLKSVVSASAEASLSLLAVNGTPRAQMTINAKGIVHQKLLDGKGEPRLIAGVDDFGHANLSLCRTPRSSLIDLRTSPEGRSRLTLCDGDGHARIEARVGEDVDSSIQFASPTGATQLSLGTSRDGTASVVLWDSGTKASAGTYVGPGGTVRQVIRGGNKLGRLEFGLDPIQNLVYGLIVDRFHRPRAGFSLGTNGEPRLFYSPLTEEPEGSARRTAASHPEGPRGVEPGFQFSAASREDANPKKDNGASNGRTAGMGKLPSGPGLRVTLRPKS